MAGVTGKAQLTKETKRGAKISFTAKNFYYPGLNTPNAATLSVAPDASEAARKGPAGNVLRFVQHVCSYEDFSINGIPVTGSVVTGTITDLPEGGWTAQGYEWICLIN